ncbi:MAG: HepT-like ribonuclease domain-containing protein [Vicinamibacterales bacterium]
MPSRDLVYVGHMLDMARKAVGKTQGISRETFDGDENLRLALIHLIQVIGEAARQVSRPFADRHPEIPWAEIIGMRHKVVHDYLGVDEDIVWAVVSQDLPTLVFALEPIAPLDPMTE